MSSFCVYFMKKGRQARHRIPRNSCYFIFWQIICIYITYHSDTKISSTEVTLIFAIVSNFSDFPLHSMQKCIKMVVLLDQPPFVPSAGDIVFSLLFSKVI